MERDHVNFIVGGCFYCLFVEDIEKYPESYFNAVIKKEWNPEQDAPIEIDRDGMMFRYIVEFHHHGELPVTKKRITVDVVQQIQVEADFYNLPLLVKACEKYVVSCISDRFDKEHFVDCKYCSDDKDNLINVVGALWAPVCSKDEDMYFSGGDYNVELGCEREVNEVTRASVYASLDKELNHYDDVIVCLQQVYLLNQADSDCLRGGDSVLYKLLTQQESKYGLSIVPLRLRYFTDQNDSSNCDLEGEEIDLDNELIDSRNRFCRGQTKEKKKKKSILLAVPITTSSDSQFCLGSFEEPGPDGLEIATWLATGLRISKRTEVSSESIVNLDNGRVIDEVRVGLKRDVPNGNGDAPSKKVALG
eukprot:gene13191-15202_t